MGGSHKNTIKGSDFWTGRNKNEPGFVFVSWDLVSQTHNEYLGLARVAPVSGVADHFSWFVVERVAIIFVSPTWNINKNF